MAIEIKKSLLKIVRDAIESVNSAEDGELVADLHCVESHIEEVQAGKHTAAVFAQFYSFAPPKKERKPKTPKAK